ncbi:MAG: efflux RND transporter permease subunit [Sphingobacterium sp.]|nr:efflux RND transporter permease subunit [Sphingobacterium sp.]
MRDVPGTRSVYAERVATGYFLDIVINREGIARYGLAVDDVNEVIQTAIGGMNLTTTVEGRARYPVNIRYPRELRSDVDKLKRILVPVMASGSVSPVICVRQWPPPAAVCRCRWESWLIFAIIRGATAIKSEEGLMASYVYIDITGRDVGQLCGRCPEKSRNNQTTGRIPLGLERGIRVYSQDTRAFEADYSLYAAYHFRDSHSSIRGR